MLLLFKAPWQGVAAIFVAMQIGAILGARWGVRLKGKIEARRGRLPLTPR